MSLGTSFDEPLVPGTGGNEYTCYVYKNTCSASSFKTSEGAIFSLTGQTKLGLFHLKGLWQFFSVDDLFKVPF